MARYYTKRCPHCGYAYTVHHLGKVVAYGSPIRRCAKCNKTYIDKDYIEIEIEGIRDVDKMRVSPQTIVLFLGCLLISGMGIFLISGGADYAYIGWFCTIIFLASGLFLFFNELLDYKNRQKRLENEKKASKERLSNPEYARALLKIGYSIPEEYLRKKTNDGIDLESLEQNSINQNYWTAIKAAYNNSYALHYDIILNCLKNNYCMNDDVLNLVIYEFSRFYYSVFRTISERYLGKLTKKDLCALNDICQNNKGEIINNSFDNSETTEKRYSDYSCFAKEKISKNGTYYYYAVLCASFVLYGVKNNKIAVYQDAVEYGKNNIDKKMIELIQLLNRICNEIEQSLSEVETTNNSQSSQNNDNELSTDIINQKRTTETKDKQIQIQQETITNKKYIMYCNYCGNRLSEGSVYCNKCGSRLPEEIIESGERNKRQNNNLESLKKDVTKKKAIRDGLFKVGFYVLLGLVVMGATLGVLTLIFGKG